MSASLSVELQEKIRNSDPNLSASRVARDLKVSTDSVLRYRPQTRPLTRQTESAPEEKITITNDTQEIFLPKTRIHTLEQLLKYCEVDQLVWEVDRFTANKWEMGSKDPDGKVQVEPLYQIKAFLRRKKNIADAQAEIASLKEAAKLEMRWPAPVIYSTETSDNLLELMLPDLHAGKLAYSKETGHGNYDTDIAVETYRRAIDSLLQRVTSSFKIDRIVLGVGNDLLQADNIQGTTYSGTKVDTDTRYHKTYITVRKMLTEAIEKLRKIAPVDVKMVPGNHDTLSTFTIGDSLECFFHNYPDVFVDNAPMPHKIVEWGQVLLLLTHGHLGKHSDYGIWLATEYPKQFGRTKFREIHTGHRHKTALDEKFGIRVRILSALCEADAWHAANHFLSNLRVAEAFVFNKHQGLVAQFFHTEVD